MLRKTLEDDDKKCDTPSFLSGMKKTKTKKKNRNNINTNKKTSRLLVADNKQNGETLSHNSFDPRLDLKEEIVECEYLLFFFPA